MSHPYSAENRAKKHRENASKHSRLAFMARSEGDGIHAARHEKDAARERDKARQLEVDITEKNDG